MAHYIGNKIYWRRDNAFSKEFLQKVDEIAKQKKLVDLKIHGKEGMNTIRDSKGCFLNDKYRQYSSCNQSSKRGMYVAL